MYIPPKPNVELPSWLRPFARPLAQYGVADYVLFAVLSLAELLPPHRLRLAALLRCAAFFFMLPAQFIFLSYLP